jgi:hypothetical protein
MYTHKHQNRWWWHFGKEDGNVFCFEFYFSLCLRRFSSFYNKYEAHDLSVRIFDWAIWFDLWAYEHEWRGDVPWWSKYRRRFNWHPLDTFFGRSKHNLMNSHEPVHVVMPERIYRAKVEFIHWKQKRPRWPFPRRGHWIKITMHEGDALPFPGKGESAWDCGDNATYGRTCSETTIEKAIDSLIDSVKEKRLKYGGKNWRPSPLTVEEKLDEKRFEAIGR